MTEVLLVGATGELGSALRPRLRDAGLTVRAGSRDPPAASADGETWVDVDVLDADSVQAAVAGIDIVVNGASAPLGDSEAVDVGGTDRLLDAAADADVEQFVYPSIVGIDDIPYAYYQAKVGAEAAVETGDVPWTIVRATQFHQFIDEIFMRFRWLPVWPLPTRFRLQPVDVGVVADAIVEAVVDGAEGRLEPVAGPEVHTVGDLARTYRSARGWYRPVVRLPLPGATARAFRAGHACAPEEAAGTLTWAGYLAETYG